MSTYKLMKKGLNTRFWHRGNLSLMLYFNLFEGVSLTVVWQCDAHFMRVLLPTFWKVSKLKSQHHLSPHSSQHKPGMCYLISNWSGFSTVMKPLCRAGTKTGPDGSLSKTASTTWPDSWWLLWPYSSHSFRSIVWTHNQQVQESTQVLLVYNQLFWEKDLAL